MQNVAVNDPQPQPRRLVKADAVANLLEVKPARVYELAQQDLIPHVRMGRQVRFDLGKVESWIEAGGQALPGGWRHDSESGSPQ